MYVYLNLTFIDTKSAEYIVFIKYYNKLMRSLKNCTDQLYYICLKLDSLYFRWLIEDYVDEVINEDATKAGMWLAIIAMKLYCDSTELFYDMLKFMKSSKEDPSIQQLAVEMHTKVKEFDPLMSSGMYVCTVCIHVHNCANNVAKGIEYVALAQQSSVIVTNLFL